MTVTLSEAYGLAVAAEVRAWAGRRGLNQARLAELLGENEIWVSRRLRNRVHITVEDVARFASVLDCSVAALMPELDVLADALGADLVGTQRYPVAA